MENQVPIDKIIRNIATKGAEFSEEVQQWLNSSEQNMQVYIDLYNLWQVTGSFPERFTPDKSKAWRKVQSHIQTQNAKYNLIRKFKQIAAAIIIIMLSIWVGMELEKQNPKLQYTEVISPAGQKTRIILPDSSIVLLNGNSKIKYSQFFNEKDRKVELTGEGYFDVRKDASRSFIVSTNELRVKVFGTAFNIKAYDNDVDVEISLKSGSIGIDRNDDEVLRLSPGEMAIFDKEGQTFLVEKVDADLVSAWTRDEMVFEENSFNEIIKYLERWYGVQIQVAPELLDGELYTFKVKTESLLELLKLINLLKPIEYQIDGKQVVISKP